MEMDETPAAWTSLVLLERFRDGDDLAAEALFSRYFERLTLLARSRLSPRLASRTDPEDIVLSVYRSFFVGARAGRFALSRGGDLWRLLASITKHKLLRQARHHGADRRSVDCELPLDQAEQGRFPGRQQEPTPEDALALADELEWVLSQLNLFGRRVLGTPVARSRALGNRGRHRPIGAHRPTHSRSNTRTPGRATGRCLTTISNRESWASSRLGSGMVRARSLIFWNVRAALTSQERRRLLVELICIDLEFRWRNRSRNMPSHERAHAGGLCREVSRVRPSRPIAARTHR